MRKYEKPLLEGMRQAFAENPALSFLRDAAGHIHTSVAGDLTGENIDALLQKPQRDFQLPVGGSGPP